MPIAVQCPTCQARLSAPDAAAGKRVKCAKCQAVIPVPVPAPTPAPAADSGFEVVDNSPADNGFEVVDPPARPAAPAARKPAPAKALRRDDEDDDRPARRPRVEDDDEDDDRPRGRRRDREDDEDEDDDRPAKSRSKTKAKGKPKKKGKSNLPLILVGAAVVLFLLCGGGLTTLLMLYGARDEEERARNQQPRGTLPVAPAFRETTWVRLDGPSQSFVAMFPNGPGVKTDLASAITDPETRRQAQAMAGAMDLWVREDNGRKYAVMAMALPDGIDPAASGQFFDVVTNGYLQKLPGAQVTDSVTGMWKSVPYRKFTVKLAGASHLVRMVLAGNRFYQLLVEGDAKLTEADTIATGFFERFEPKATAGPPRNNQRPPDEGQKKDPNTPKGPPRINPRPKRP